MQITDPRITAAREIDKSLHDAGLSLGDQLTVLTDVLAERLASIGPDAKVREVTSGAHEILTRTVNDRLAAKRRMLS